MIRESWINQLKITKFYNYYYVGSNTDSGSKIRDGKYKSTKVSNIENVEINHSI
jgi:hypothetical protein